MPVTPSLAGYHLHIDNPGDPQVSIEFDRADGVVTVAFCWPDLLARLPPDEEFEDVPQDRLGFHLTYHRPTCRPAIICFDARSLSPLTPLLIDRAGRAQAGDSRRAFQTATKLLASWRMTPKSR